MTEKYKLIFTGDFMCLTNQQTAPTEIKNGAGYFLDVKLFQWELVRIRKLEDSHAVSLASKYYPELNERNSQTSLNLDV